MKTKNMIYSMSALLVLSIGFTGCTHDLIESSDDAPSSTQYSSGTIKYSDGTDFGVTRKEPMNNGGFQIYSIGSGEVIGFIQINGAVNDIGGNDLGMCQNATITDAGLNGDCLVPTTAPQSVNNGNTTNAPVISNSTYPAIPNYPAGANSIGQLDVNCKEDIIYYTLSYICFKSTVKLSTTADGNAIAEDKDSTRGSNPWTYYEQGQYNRNGSRNQVEIVGTVIGGNPGGTYRKTCPSI